MKANDRHHLAAGENYEFRKDWKPGRRAIPVGCIRLFAVSAKLRDIVGSIGNSRTFVKFETERRCDGTSAAYVDMSEVCAVETNDTGATSLILRSGHVLKVTNHGLAPGVNWPEHVNVVTMNAANEINH